MKRRIRNMMMGGSVVCQVIVMMMYSFGDYAVSKYCYLAVWTLCAVLIKYICGTERIL